MKARLRSIVLIATVAALASGCVSMRTATAWRQACERELAAGSEMAQTAAGPIEYARRGDGSAVVLALHGAMGGYDAGLAAAEALKLTGITLISVSRPGYLRTPIETGRTPAEEADAYAALLDTLGIKSVAVIGASGGGPPALEFAIRHPDRCWGLVLLSAIVEQKGLDNFTPLQRLWFRNSMGDRQSYRSVQMLEKDPAKAIATMAPETALDLADKPKKMAFAVKLADTSFPMCIRSVGTLNDVESKHTIPVAALRSIGVPTLILHGALDKWAPVATARMAAAAIPNARLVVDPTGDHLFFLVETDKVHAELDRFIAANRRE